MQLTDCQTIAEVQDFIYSKWIDHGFEPSRTEVDAYLHQAALIGARKAKVEAKKVVTEERDYAAKENYQDPYISSAEGAFAESILVIRNIVPESLDFDTPTPASESK